MTDQDRPRLLFVAPQARFFISHRLPLAVAAQSQGYRTYLACPSDEQASRLSDYGVQHIALPVARASRNPFGDWRMVWRLNRIFAAHQPQLVHLITAKATLYGGLIARMRGIPTVAAITGLGFLFSTDSLSNRLVRSALLRAYGIGLDRPDCTIIFQNSDDRNLFQASGILVRNEALTLPGAGADLTRFTPRPLPQGPVTVVLPSRMMRMKGVLEFCEAASILQRRGVSANMSLVGDPELENPTGLSQAELEQLVESTPVTWTAHREDIECVLADAHIVALPSHGGEGLPKTLVDAAAAGRAAVTTDVPGCREAVVPGETGLICRPRDATDLADALQRLIEDPAQIAAMGAGARRRAERVFNVQHIVAEHLATYDRLAGRGGGLQER